MAQNYSSASLPFTPLSLLPQILTPTLSSPFFFCFFRFHFLRNRYFFYRHFWKRLISKVCPMKKKKKAQLFFSGLGHVPGFFPAGKCSKTRPKKRYQEASEFKFTNLPHVVRATLVFFFWGGEKFARAAFRNFYEYNIMTFSK